MSRSSIPRSLRDAVFDRDRGRCRYCRLAQFGHGATFHIDHVLPRSRGGTTAANNLVLQCPNCSLRKADKALQMNLTIPRLARACQMLLGLLQAG